MTCTATSGVGTIPLSRLAHAIPFMEFLGKIGAPVEAGLRAAKLPVKAGTPDLVVPVQSIWDFAYLMSRREGIETLGFEAGAVGFENLSAPVWRGILGAPSLFTALKRFEKQVSMEGNRARVGMSQQGRSVLLWHLGAFDDHPGLPVMEQYFVTILLAAVRSFLGPRWQPPAIGFQSAQVPRRVSELFPETRFLVRQPAHFVQIPFPELSAPSRGRASTRDGDDPGKPEFPVGFVASLRELLGSYLADGGPDLELAAELAGTSRRTLQRRLGEADLTFSELLDQARFRTATRMLADPSFKIVDIAHEVGYENPSHFARSFRRIAGLSPSRYRRTAIDAVA